MEAANRGAGRENSFGINIRLPKRTTRQSSHRRRFQTDAIQIFFHTQTDVHQGIRSHHSISRRISAPSTKGLKTSLCSKPGKCMPQPRYSGRTLKMEPTGKNSFTCSKKNFFHKGYISSMDMNLFHIVHSVKEAVQYLEDYYRYYHSLRYVKQYTVLRFTKTLSPAVVEYLNHEFRDILKTGDFQGFRGAGNGKSRESISRPASSGLSNSTSTILDVLNEMILWINRNLN